MAANQIDRQLIADLTAREEKTLEDQSPKSFAMFQRASKHMPMGVASTYHARDPYPVYFTHGKGPHIWTVDGQEISDFHNGFGCMVQGHAHPMIVEAIQKRAPLGTQFGLPTEDAIIMAEHLAEAFKLPQWRFVNSGSEATMDAIRVARAFTGRETIIKMFGSYHGHHDYVMVSIGVADFGDDRPARRLRVAALRRRHPAELHRHDHPGAVQRRREHDQAHREAGRRRATPPACVIMEPAMMNLGVVLPEPGFLEGVRAITKKHGIVLIFDEVKTGICTAAGGAVERWGVVPDMITPRQGPRRRHAVRRHRRDRRDHGQGQRRHRVPGRHLQRQPAVHGRRARQLGAGHDPRRLRAPQLPQRPASSRGATPSAPSTTSPATPWASRPRAASTSPPARSPTTSRSSSIRTTSCGPRLALQLQPRHHHRPRPRRGVDAVDHSHRRRHRPLRERLRGPRAGT